MTAFLRFEIVRSLRNVRFVVFIAGFPVLLYLIYAKQTGISQGLTVAAILMVSMAVWSGMGSAMFASGPQLARGYLGDPATTALSPSDVQIILAQAISLRGKGNGGASRQWPASAACCAGL